MSLYSSIAITKQIYSLSLPEIPFLGNMDGCHFLLVTFPAQSHINPSLQFAKNLAKMGAKVTFSTSLYATRSMTGTASLPEGLTIFPFSDGYDDGLTKSHDVRDFVSSFITRGCEAVTDLILGKANEGHPFTHVVYTTLMSWVGRVTHELQIPSTLLWIQPAALFDIYYYFFNGYGDVIQKSSSSNNAIELPGLPLLTSHDLPSFLLASSPDLYNFALPAMKEHVEYVEKKENPKILVNTFDALEPEALKSIKHLEMMGVGPLIPSAFLDGKDPSDASFGGDLHKKSGDINYVEWLNSKSDASVVYVAFGSFSDLPLKQLEEIANGLLESQRPFLWVIRPAKDGQKLEEKLSCKDELEKQGVIVPWCSQVEVLSHPSVGCFVTHCGWNSSLESLVFGVPVVGMPLWSDQSTNVKLIQDVWKTGKRVMKNEEEIVDRDELRRCLEIVMGSEEMRSNARKWKDLAVEATRENGSSNINLKAFLEEVGAGVSTRPSI